MLRGRWLFSVSRTRGLRDYLFLRWSQSGAFGSGRDWELGRLHVRVARYLFSLPFFSPTTSNRTKTGTTEFSSCVNVEGVTVGVSAGPGHILAGLPATGGRRKSLDRCHAGIRTDKRELVDDGEAVGG